MATTKKTITGSQTQKRRISVSEFSKSDNKNNNNQQDSRRSSLSVPNNQFEANKSADAKNLPQSGNENKSDTNDNDNTNNKQKTVKLKLSPKKSPKRTPQKRKSSLPAKQKFEIFETNFAMVILTKLCSYSHLLFRTLDTHERVRL